MYLRNLFLGLMKRVNSCCTDTIVGLFINYQVHRRKFCCYCLYSTQPEISWPSYKHVCTTWTKADSTAYWDIRAWIQVYFESVIPLVSLILLLLIWRILYHINARCVVTGDLICSTPLHQSLQTKSWVSVYDCELFIAAWNHCPLTYTWK